MTLTHQTSSGRTLARAVLALLVLALATLSAASAASAAAPDPTATAPVATTTPSGSDPAAQRAAPAPAAAPSAPAATDPTVGTASGGATATSAPDTNAMPRYGDDIQPQPVVIAQGSGDAPIGHPTHDAPSPPASRPNLEVPIVSTSHRPPVGVRATVTQLASGGPFITAAAPPAAAVHAAPAPVKPRAIPLGLGLPIGPYAQHPPAPQVVGVSVPLVDVYISSETSTHHPGEKSSPQMSPPTGPAGLGATTLSSFAPGPLPQPGGPALFGNNAPTSSSGGSSSALLGLNAMLAAMTLLAGMSWRRRSWARPVLQGESALLASALDRPG